MALFSHRQGLKPAKKLIQHEFLDVETRNSIWNLICDALGAVKKVNYEDEIWIFKIIWTEYFKETRDTHPDLGYSRDESRNYYYYYRSYLIEKSQWNECLDFIEFFAKLINYIETQNQYRYQNSCLPNLKDRFNDILERESSAYRFVGLEIAEITSKVEIDAIEKAIDNSAKSIQKHLQSALEKLTDRKTPDYRNSMKESISAVESACCIITGKSNATLGSAIKEIEKRYAMHPALKKAFEALYGYTSDESGVRHGSIDIADIDFAMAKYMLVTCSAFINYIAQYSGKNMTA